MVYRATEEVVRRVLPLLDRLADRTIDKARLLQYLSAQAGVAWDALDIVGESFAVDDGGLPTRALLFRDRSTGAESTIVYPGCLPPDLDALVQEEYRRLATAKPLTVMNPALFEALFGLSHCEKCRWRGPGHEQVNRECYFAGHPINFEPRLLS